jgi:nitronate monooxygenase
MWPRRDFANLVGIEHPIVQAPMPGFATPELAAAVSNAGGLGSLGCAFMSPDELAGTLRRVADLTDRPVNFNFFCHRPPRRDEAAIARMQALVEPYFAELDAGPVPDGSAVPPPFGRAQLEVLTGNPPAVVSFHFGLPAAELLGPLKRAGCRILASATTVREAELLAERGADAIIAQGWEAGGHRATFAVRYERAMVGTLALTPQIVDAVDRPVIAAGGIADGRGIAAALALGASGVQIGTAFLLAEEAATPEPHRRAIGRSDDASTVVTAAISGRPARAIVNRYVEAMASHAAELPDFPVPMAVFGPLQRTSIARDEDSFAAMWAGQASALTGGGRAEEILGRLIAQTAEVGGILAPLANAP